MSKRDRYEVGVNDEGTGPWRVSGSREVALEMGTPKAAREGRPVTIRDTETGRVVAITPDGEEKDLPADLGAAPSEPEPPQAEDPTE